MNEPERHHENLVGHWSLGNVSIHPSIHLYLNVWTGPIFTLFYLLASFSTYLSPWKSTEISPHRKNEDCSQIRKRTQILNRKMGTSINLEMFNTKQPRNIGKHQISMTLHAIISSYQQYPFLKHTFCCLFCDLRQNLLFSKGCMFCIYLLK